MQGEEGQKEMGKADKESDEKDDADIPVEEEKEKEAREGETIINKKEQSTTSHDSPARHVSPPHRLIILDVNGLLFKRDYSIFPQKAQHMVCDRPVYLRPGLGKFIQFCLENFSVVIWSSMIQDNLSPLMELICRVSSIGPTAFCFIYNQNNCEGVSGDNPKSPKVPLLMKSFYKIQVSLGPSNTLFIDDTPVKGKCNGEHKCISPIKYDGNPKDNVFETNALLS
ncbi:hypothetical protein L7F22_005884 [Adiantum nelumboides]|nr:hypothetical protein [Adiantum nelumboides]